MHAIHAGATAQEINEATGIDPWFVDQLFLIDEVAQEVREAVELRPSILRRAKRHGFSDAQLAELRGRSEEHTSELQSLMRISYAVFCLKKKTNKKKNE